MIMKKKSVLLYCNGIDDVILGTSKVAGIQVQMSFWAKVFVDIGWNVYTFTEGEARTINGINFISENRGLLDSCHLSVVSEVLSTLPLLFKTKPDLVLLNGASRFCLIMSFFSGLYGSKFVFWGASDTDFEIGKELVAGSRLNVLMYRRAIASMRYIATQNIKQAESLKANYGKQSLILPNIWPSVLINKSRIISYDAAWVANIRDLKRVEWFLRLAQKMHNRRFVIVGGARYMNMNYYEDVKMQAALIPNLDFLGPKPFSEVNEILEQCRLLICTSEFEGFPNTFLQAWAAGVPVVSTVNPNEAITKFELGQVVDNEQQLYEVTSNILNDSLLYDKYTNNIKLYFYEHHNAESACRRLLDFVHLKP